MRILALGLLLLAACDRKSDQAPPSAEAKPDSITFDGADYQTKAAKLAHGERLASVLGCTGCHGKDLTGINWSEPGFGRLWTANLTRAIGRYSDKDLVRVIVSGQRPDREMWEMPSHLFTRLSKDDMAALILYLRASTPVGVEHPTPVFEADMRKEIAAGTFKSSRQIVAEEGAAWPPDAGSAHQLGRYVVRATCAECHGMELRGGQPFAGAKPRPDLRMVAAYDLQQFRQLLSTGKAPGGREVSLMSEVARGRYKLLSDNEVAAVHAYLQKVAEVAP